MSKKTHKSKERKRPTVVITLPGDLLQRINDDLDSLSHIPSRSHAITMVLSEGWAKWIEAERQKWAARRISG